MLTALTPKDHFYVSAAVILLEMEEIVQVFKFCILKEKSICMDKSCNAYFIFCLLGKPLAMVSGRIAPPLSPLSTLSSKLCTFSVQNTKK